MITLVLLENKEPQLKLGIFCGPLKSNGNKQVGLNFDWGHPNPLYIFSADTVQRLKPFYIPNQR